MNITLRRNGGKSVFGSQCQRRNYTLERTLTASRDYDNMAEWFDGDNIGFILNDGVQELGSANETMDNTELPKITAGGAPSSGVKDQTEVATIMGAGAVTPEKINYYTLYEDNTTNSGGPNLPYLLVSSTDGCSTTENKQSTVEVQFTVVRSNSITVFETEPAVALDDVWYENNESFDIGATGLHLGNVQNQTLINPAIINTGFFNCFAFGNGVESYKVRDSIKGKSFNLGNRLFTTSNVQFKKSPQIC